MRRSRTPSALIAYLRIFPKVAKEIPSARPPVADDCDTYHFFLRPPYPPGCRR